MVAFDKKPSKPHFCKNMRSNYFTPHSKESMAKDIEDRLVIYIPQFLEYGLPIQDGGNSYLLIRYCPWCGAKLPKSRRNEWLSKMSKLGYSSPFSQKIPEVYLHEDWEKHLPRKSSKKKETGKSKASTVKPPGAHRSKV